MSLLVKGVTDFLGLTDTPASYAGQAGKLIKVNPGENGLNMDLLLSFTDWYAGGAPTSYPWEFEATLPADMSTTAHFFTPILRNELDQAYVYVIGFNTLPLFKYNFFSKQWSRLADVNVAGNIYRPPALSPDGTKIAVCAGDGRRLEVYNIATNTWSVGVNTAPDILATQSAVQCCVWASDNDTLWTLARAYVGGTTWHCKFMKYVVSTDTWSSFANDITPAVTNPQCMGIKSDDTVVYAGQCGANYYTYCKYTVATDTYGYGNVGSQRRFFYACHSRYMWYTFEGDYAFHFLDCDDESTHVNQFPANPQRNKPSNWSLGVEGQGTTSKSAMCHARTAAPRNMSYFGSGSWRLAQVTITDYNLVVFQKPSDGFAISAVNTVSGFYIPIHLFDTLCLPDGTWEFFYPKDGDYTQLKISASELK